MSEKILDELYSIFGIIFLFDLFVGFLPGTLSLISGWMLNAVIIYRYQHLFAEVFYGEFSIRKTSRLVLTVWAFAFFLCFLRNEVTPELWLSSFVSFSRSVHLLGILMLFSLLCALPIGHILWKRSNFKRWSGPIPTLMNNWSTNDIASELRLYRKQLFQSRTWSFLVKFAAGLVFSVFPIFFGMYLYVFHLFTGLFAMVLLLIIVNDIGTFLTRKQKPPKSIVTILLREKFAPERESFVTMPRGWGVKGIATFFLILLAYFFLGLFSVVIWVPFVAFDLGFLDVVSFLLALGLISYMILPLVSYQFLFLIRLSRRMRQFIKIWSISNRESFKSGDASSTGIVPELPVGGLGAFATTLVPYILGGVVIALDDPPMLDLAVRGLVLVWPIPYLILLFLSLKRQKKCPYQTVLSDNRNIPIVVISYIALIGSVMLASGYSLMEHMMLWWFCLLVISLFYFDDFYDFVGWRFRKPIGTFLQFCFFPLVFVPLILFGYLWIWVAFTILVIFLLVAVFKIKKELIDKTTSLRVKSNVADK